MGRTPSPTDPPHGTATAGLWLEFFRCSCLLQSIPRVVCTIPEEWDANGPSWLCLPIAPVSMPLQLLGGRDECWGLVALLPALDSPRMQQFAVHLGAGH